MNTMRQASLPGYDLGDYIKESIDFLRTHEPPEGYFVGFSGGKDSITTLQLCKLAGVRHQAFYSCTRIDPPEVVRFIRREYPQVTWLYPKMTMWEGIKSKSPPLRMHRWCCDVLKKAPAKNHPLKNRVMGIRAEESVRRAGRPRVDTFWGQTTHKPIFTWPEWAVWEFIEYQNLAYPSLYDEGFHRIGCVICPYIMGKSPCAVKQRQISQRRWPGMWKVFEKSIKQWWQGRREKGMPLPKASETADSFWQDYLNGFEK